MSNSQSLHRHWFPAWVALLALSCFVTVSRAEETQINKLKQANKNEEKLATIVGEKIVNAAHPTGKRVGYVRHELKDDPKKENRKLLNIKMEYFGAVTGKRYVTEIDIKIEVSRTGWEVLDIEYSDNNNIKANLVNIQALKKKLNQSE
jgi:hypothetical protein